MASKNVFVPYLLQFLNFFYVGRMKKSNFFLEQLGRKNFIFNEIWSRNANDAKKKRSQFLKYEISAFQRRLNQICKTFSSKVIATWNLQNMAKIDPLRH